MSTSDLATLKIRRPSSRDINLKEKYLIIYIRRHGFGKILLYTMSLSCGLMPSIGQLPSSLPTFENR
jgi:hypothetical protein